MPERDKLIPLTVNLRGSPSIVRGVTWLPPVQILKTDEAKVVLTIERLEPPMPNHASGK